MKSIRFVTSCLSIVDLLLFFLTDVLPTIVLMITGILLVHVDLLVWIRRVCLNNYLFHMNHLYISCKKSIMSVFISLFIWCLVGISDLLLTESFRGWCMDSWERRGSLSLHVPTPQYARHSQFNRTRPSLGLN